MIKDKNETQVDKQLQLQQLRNLYIAAATLAGEAVLERMLEPNGTLRCASMICPFCINENAADDQESTDNELVFNFGEFVFHCGDCDADYTLEEILTQLVDMASGWCKRLKGLTLLLPLLLPTGGTSDDKGDTHEA